jgi:hypothetical protein
MRSYLCAGIYFQREARINEKRESTRGQRFLLSPGKRRVKAGAYGGEPRGKNLFGSRRKRKPRRKLEKAGEN